MIPQLQCNETMNYDDNLRLYNGTDSSGMLQIYREDEWRILCGGQFTRIEGEIACRQLGFSSLARIKLSHNGTERLVKCCFCGAFNSCNMGMSVLPDMYSRIPKAAGPRDKSVHIRQEIVTETVKDINIDDTFID